MLDNLKVVDASIKEISAMITDCNLTDDQLAALKVALAALRIERSLLDE